MNLNNPINRSEVAEGLWFQTISKFIERNRGIRLWHGLQNFLDVTQRIRRKKNIPANIAYFRRYVIDHNHFTVVVNGVCDGRFLIAASAAFNGASHFFLIKHPMNPNNPINHGSDSRLDDFHFLTQTRAKFIADDPVLDRIVLCVILEQVLFCYAIFCGFFFGKFF